MLMLKNVNQVISWSLKVLWRPPFDIEGSPLFPLQEKINDNKKKKKKMFFKSTASTWIFFIFPFPRLSKLFYSPVKWSILHLDVDIPTSPPKFVCHFRALDFVRSPTLECYHISEQTGKRKPTKKKSLHETHWFDFERQRSSRKMPMGRTHCNCR